MVWEIWVGWDDGFRASRVHACDDWEGCGASEVHACDALDVEA